MTGGLTWEHAVRLALVAARTYGVKQFVFKSKARGWTWESSE